MRSQGWCEDDAREFLKELVKAGKPLFRTVADKRTRAWCKSRKLVIYKAGGQLREGELGGWSLTKNGEQVLSGDRAL